MVIWTFECSHMRVGMRVDLTIAFKWKKVKYARGYYFEIQKNNQNFKNLVNKMYYSRVIVSGNVKYVRQKCLQYIFKQNKNLELKFKNSQIRNSWNFENQKIKMKNDFAKFFSRK